MRKLLCLLLVSLSVTLFGVVQAELDAYLPMLDLLQSERYPEAIAAGEKIATKNRFATVALYLIYSRGYGDTPINYAKAAEYLNIIFGYDEQLYWSIEYRDVWCKMRIPPTDTEKTATIKALGYYRVIDEKFNLKGKYPLGKCYEDEMANIGGVGARALQIVGQYYAFRDKEFQERIMALARIKGSAAAMQWPLTRTSFNHGDITLEIYRRLLVAAEAGHVPCMILTSEICQKNYLGVPPDPVTAGKFLHRAIAKCQSYEAIGCKHAKEHLALAETMLKSVPDITLKTQELIDDMIKSYGDSKRIDALVHEIAKRDDHPSCLYFKSQLLPRSEKAKALAMIKKAAANNSREAIWSLLGSSNDKDYWLTLYLAGKNNLPARDPGEKDSYYRRSFMALKKIKFSIPPTEYRSALAQLSDVDEWAKEAYTSEFGNETGKAGRVAWKIRDTNTISADWIELEGRKTIKVKVAPSEDANHIDFTFQEVPNENHFELSIFSNIAGLGSNDVWADALLPNKSKQRIYVGAPYRGKRPTKMRLNISPTEKPYELLLLGL